MIELPGSFSGITISPSPQRGPEASQRTSLAIFISATASVFSAPCSATSASWPASAANLFGAVMNGSPVIVAIFCGDAHGVLGMRVQTRADRRAAERELVEPAAAPPRPRATARSSCATQPENSWPSVSGVASCKCVRPIFTMSAKAAPSRRAWPEAR